MRLLKNNISPNDLHIGLNDSDFDIGAPDGEYFAAWLNSFNYYNDFEDYPFQTYDYYSMTPIIVIGGLVDYHTLRIACAEILSENGYWGVFVEAIHFNKQKNVIEIDIGS